MTARVYTALAGAALALATIVLYLTLHGHSEAAAGTAITVDASGDGMGGCTVRNAIDSADTNTSIGGCAAGTGDDTVQIPPGVVSSPLELDQGLLIVGDNTGTLAVNGPGVGALDVRPHSGSASRIIQVSTANDPVTISGMTISHAAVTEESGGAVTVPGGSILTLDHVAVTGNNDTITTTTSAQVGGAGITVDGTLTMRDSTVNGNHATIAMDSGGSGTVTASGGGIKGGAGSTLTIDRSTISGNSVTATTSAGGTTTQALGGGVYLPPPSGSNKLTLTRSTVSGNQASGDGVPTGGGIFSLAAGIGGGMTLEGDTITGNTALTAANAVAVGVTVGSTIVSDPLGSGGQNCNFATTVSEGFNLEDSNSCDFSQATDQSGVASTGLDPNLATNGGPTMTHALLPGSPAIDRGKSFNAGPDQRGLTRPVDFPGLTNAAGGDGTDIGSFEVQQTCAGQATPGASCAQPAPPPAAGPTGQQAAAIKKCKKKYPGKAKAKKRKKCIKKAKLLPV